MKEQLLEQMNVLWATFQEQQEGTTKKSQAAARKALSGLKKIISSYNKESVKESKQA